VRLYIAGPMTGLPEFNYPAFREAEARLSASGFDALNPINSEQHNDTGKPQTWDWYLRHALRMVLEADGLALLDGWWRSRGATLEVHVARSLELPTEPVDHWIATTYACCGEPTGPVVHMNHVCRIGGAS
jgi:nucleoside 2-deoxyribosyltransferase